MTFLASPTPTPRLRALSFLRLAGACSGDSKKLGAIEAGSDIQVRRHEKALRWFADNWPEGAIWPVHVTIPAPEPIATKRRKHGRAA